MVASWPTQCPLSLNRARPMLRQRSQVLIKLYSVRLQVETIHRVPECLLRLDISRIDHVISRLTLSPRPRKQRCGKLLANQAFPPFHLLSHLSGVAVEWAGSSSLNCLQGRCAATARIGISISLPFFTCSTSKTFTE